MKKNTIIHTFTWETYKFSKNDSKIHEKVYKLVYSRILQMFNKIHKIYTNFLKTILEYMK